MPKELDIHIRRNGYNYHQSTKNDNGYIYAQDLNGKTIAYEVFERRVNKMYDTVSFPGDNAFGSWAWSCRTYEDAFKKLQQIEESKIKQ